jgi:hypothetical protein
MRIPAPSAFLLLPVLLSATAAAELSDSDLLIVWPLDTAVVQLDSGVPTEPLLGERNKRRAPSSAFRIAREFHPRFGAAVALAARNVGVIDSSAAGAEVLSLGERVRLPDTAAGTILTFDLPVAADADSARYALVFGSLAITQESKSVARRFVPPSPPGFDPATGQMTPGLRSGYMEGPGLMTTLTATAAWVIWDRDAGVAVAHGTAVGNSSFRGDARRSNWDEAARELAKDVLRQTPFSPFR